MYIMCFYLPTVELGQTGSSLHAVLKIIQSNYVESGQESGTLNDNAIYA